MDRNLLENNYKKANNQLFHIACRKSIIKKEIYSLYNNYLSIIRSKLRNYVGEAIKVLLDITSEGISVKDQETIIFLKKDLKNIVNKILPFLTIEQLSIKKEYKIANKIENNIELNSNYNLKEEVYFTKDFETIHSNNSTFYYSIYYSELINKDDFKDINFDNYLLEDKNFDNSNKDESLIFINSITLPEVCDEDKLSTNFHQSKNSKYFIPLEFNDILLWIDNIEYSLNLYLQDLSIEVNNELQKRNIIRRFLNNDLLLHIFENRYLFNNPSPFILTFDPSLNQYLNIEEIFKEKKFSKLNLININTAELEFININLNMLKNKLLEIKSRIYLLIKKENYWSNKLRLNSKIKSAMNKP